MIRCKRSEWKWASMPAFHGDIKKKRYDIHSLNGHGQLSFQVDRDHVAGDPPPNAAVPVSRNVILLRMPEMNKVRSGWSDGGEVTFTYLDMTVPYLAFSPGFIGPTGVRFDSVCTDSHEDGSLLYPELMSP